MGAPLASATQMILTVGTDHATPPIPDKRQRAERDPRGLDPVCRQAGGSACASGEVASVVGSAHAAASHREPRLRPSLPAAGLDPFKYGRFVIDEPASSTLRGEGDGSRALRAGEGTRRRVRDPRGQRPQGPERAGLCLGDDAPAADRQARRRQRRGGGGRPAPAPGRRSRSVPGFAKEAEFSTPTGSCCNGSTRRGAIATTPTAAPGGPTTCSTSSADAGERQGDAVDDPVPDARRAPRPLRPRQRRAAAAPASVRTRDRPAARQPAAAQRHDHQPRAAGRRRPGNARLLGGQLGYTAAACGPTTVIR
jgi:hypothetical protein